MTPYFRLPAADVNRDLHELNRRDERFGFCIYLYGYTDFCQGMSHEILTERQLNGNGLRQAQPERYLST